jgi:deferrochelatase/peroxidase EfeB
VTRALVTVAIPFDTARADAVDTLLSSMGNPPQPALRQALDATGIVHFMSITAIRETTPGRTHLVLEASADGGLPAALDRIAVALSSELSDLLTTARIATGDKTLPDFLASHCLSLGAGWFNTAGFAFDGMPGLSVQRIRDEARLADRILAEMSDVLAAPMPARAKLQAVREWLWQDGEKWAFSAEATPFLTGGTTRTPVLIALMAVTVAGILLWPLLVVPAVLMAFFGIWPGILTTLVLLVIAGALGVTHLRRLEKENAPDNTVPDAAGQAEIDQRESHCAQNLLVAHSVMQAGWLRRLTLRFAFGMTTEGVRHIFRPGYLRQIGVIHFARWVLIPGTDSLVFYSNFSDSWESYLEDFISKAADGLTAIWSNTLGFPRTQFLFSGGAADGDRFRRWARRQQIPARFWYSAYPELKTQRIRMNAAIRQGIAAARTEAEMQDWLTCFGSAPRPTFELEKPEIQTLVFGALKRLRFSACLVLTLSEDRDAARAWLRGIEARITYGEHTTPHRAMSVAFTATGLRKLGLAGADLATFSLAFQHGMTAPWRSRILGDRGKHAPDTWLWGGPSQTDVLIYLFAYDEKDLQEAIGHATQAAESSGHRIAFQQVLKPLPEHGGQVFEPFGFADGVSQPVLRDTPRARVARNQEHIVDAGEFVLGYPDLRGYVPLTPTIGPGRDPNRILPEFVDDPSGTREPFTSGRSGRSDFGRNGTYMVVRHLEQDVAGFKAWVDRETARLEQENLNVWSLPTAELKELVAAKTVGRWRDGASLVRHPHPPGTPALAPALPTGRPVRTREPDNDFLYAREDPQGLRCPFGAHMRRANPRDSLDTDGPAQLAIVNRHRLIRVGRQYEAAENGKPGLLFTCLNADIERQFEFVQQTWLLGSNFHGLPDETDPSLGHGERPFTIPTQQGPVRLTGLPDFVRVRGGAYFFMPSRSAIRYLATLADRHGDT